MGGMTSLQVYNWVDVFNMSSLTHRSFQNGIVYESHNSPLTGGPLSSVAITGGGKDFDICTFNVYITSTGGATAQLAGSISSCGIVAQTSGLVDGHLLTVFAGGALNPTLPVTYSDRVDIYNHSSGLITLEVARLSVPRRRGLAVIVKEKLFVVGGEDDTTKFNVVDVIQLSTTLGGPALLGSLNLMTPIWPCCCRFRP